MVLHSKMTFDKICAQYSRLYFLGADIELPPFTDSSTREIPMVYEYHSCTLLQKSHYANLTLYLIGVSHMVGRKI